MRSRYRWSPEDLMRLEEMLGAGMSDTIIGRRLGCTALAVNIVRKRRGIPARRTFFNSGRTIARRLGIPSGDKTVTWWLQKGYLRGRRGQGCGPYKGWYVTDEALFDFLADARYWHLWGPERIRDLELADWAAENRNGTRFLTTGEAGQRLGVGHSTVNEYIRGGLLRAVRRGNWLIREQDLAGFVLPCERSRKGQKPQRFTVDEDRRLIALRSDGITWREIARLLDRNVGSVYNRFRRLFPLGD